MITRCVENSVYAVTANRLGSEHRSRGTLTFTGQSQLVTPEGELIYRAKPDDEELFTVKIDPANARDKTITEKNNLFADRRPEFYDEILRKS
jgi:predicted amidohydrolase